MSKNKKINVGQRMYIKSWSQLIDEFGYDEDSDYIPTPIPFPLGMKHLCGKRFTISCVIDDTYGVHYFSEEKIEIRTCKDAVLPYYVITADMLTDKCPSKLISFIECGGKNNV